MDQAEKDLEVLIAVEVTIEEVDVEEARVSIEEAIGRAVIEEITSRVT